MISLSDVACAQNLIVKLTANYAILMSSNGSDDCGPATAFSTEIAQDGARGVTDSILAFLRSSDIHSVPGDESDRVGELERLCESIQALITDSGTSSADTLILQCREALGQLYYLLELKCIRLAIVLETLCPV